MSLTAAINAVRVNSPYNIHTSHGRSRDVEVLFFSQFLGDFVPQCGSGALLNCTQTSPCIKNQVLLPPNVVRLLDRY